MEQLIIQPADPGSPDGRRLITALDNHLLSLYPPESNHLLSVEALRQPDVTFLIARINGQTAGCGAFLNHSKQYAEIKRMFVLPQFRGRGIGGRILQELETCANSLGITACRLETGIRQPEALRLYERSGYQRRGFFTPYTDDPLSVFMEKKLEPGIKEVNMERAYVIENNRQRKRLLKLVNTITDEELKLIIYKEGWTIAAALAHLAFWDKRRLVLVRKWQQQGVSPSPMNDDDVDVINDALLPFFLELNPRNAAGFAIAMAEEVDAEVEKLTPDLVDAINKLGDRHALNRSIHRKMHLDEIEILLNTSRKKKSV
jgi:putative acetyltransferase